jgi:hypothetical protein
MPGENTGRLLRESSTSDMKTGDKAVVIKCWSSDVMPGIEGVIVKRMLGG